MPAMTRRGESSWSSRCVYQDAGGVAASNDLIDSRYAVARLMVTLLLMTVGASGMYVVPVVLPTVQAEFGVARADASLPYTLLMIGFGVGGMLMGRLADRFGVAVPLLVGATGLGLGFLVSSLSGGILVFAVVHGLLIGLLGASATFAPLLADTSLWFLRRRGIAVAVCASGNYLGGAIWPPIVQHFVASAGWRPTYLGLGIFCFVSMTALALLMRRRPPLAVASPILIQLTPSAASVKNSWIGRGDPPRHRHALHGLRRRDLPGAGVLQRAVRRAVPHPAAGHDGHEAGRTPRSGRTHGIPCEYAPAVRAPGKRSRGIGRQRQPGDIDLG